ncbi:uncharacterized protein LOC124946901 [Vespa velutina]|uniref:uncharacterized protein LOC124946901 n=1 Tax=Vespa velutina TaxID=202808 RepID=UPI001FB33384|nr:uncharacterized protein LOC124946901 [Vespa velutina]XP_047344274.1 uncharacterized protein LOC124946901 [Vespa velutina]XP_047344275.1 uncharacterized protein LOC124946901 [Vespa velutina]
MLRIVILLIHILLVVARPTENDVENDNTTDIEFLRNNCVLSTEYKHGDLKEPQPLILTRNGTASAILYPNVNGTLNVRAGQSIYLACPGERNFIKNMDYAQEVKATCVRNKIFHVNGENRNFSSLICYHLPEHIARRTKSSCYNKNTHVEIGFNLSTNFLRVIELCRNEKTYNTYYTKFRLTKSIGGYQRSYPRPSKWMVGDYYGKIDINWQYNFNEQLITLAKLLNSSEIAKSHLTKSKQFLSRGHMTAKADFIYGALQSLTFWYINAAPQWMSFNAGNWEILESNVRNFATDRSLDLDVYTGVHGQMTLPNARGKQENIYLYVNGTTKAVPVPKFYWKIIYDPRSQKGTAFVGLNDPFIKSITEDIYICSDISSTIEWLDWRPNDIKAGISYACTIDDLREAVPTIPKFKTIGLLT